MAFLKAVTTNHGLEVVESYVRIDELSGGKNSVHLRVRYYLSALACIQGSEWLQEAVYTFEPNVTDEAVNFLKQGYEYLKTLPEFETAVDC